ncbi:MAG TPA: hypothetical protein ENO17_06500, partial [Candidatus Atribacteria bacterium]|nr:hypothetical protein [Candidatus Atribacteria bacterium]
DNIDHANNISPDNSDNNNIGNFAPQTIEAIFQDTSMDLSPCWSPDGQYLFFASDRTGVYNIFAFSLPDKKLYQVTNVLGGAFQPATSSDGTQLAFISYHTTGYELHLMEIDPNSYPSQWTEIKIEYVEPPIMVTQPYNQSNQFNQSNQYNQLNQFNKNLNSSSNSFVINNYPIHPYHPLSSFWPSTYWIPTARLSNSYPGIGFSTELKDILGFYSLPLSLTYQILNNSLSYNFNYYNYSFRLPIVNFYLYGNTTSTTTTPTTSWSWWKEGKAGINIYLPFEGNTNPTTNTKNSRSNRQNFSFGYQYEKLSSAPTNTSSFLNDDSQKITSLKLGYSYSDAEKYGFSISPELGNSFSLSYEHADKALGGDYTFDKLLFDGRKYISLSSLHQVLALRLVAGVSSASILESDLSDEKFKLGGNYSADNLGTTEVNTFSLRGYPPATLEGNNLLLASIEYRFPLVNIEHGITLGPLYLFLERLSGALFVDIGSAWESPQVKKTIKENEFNTIWQDFKSSIGAELKADFNFQYDFPFTLRLGAAKTLNDQKGYDIYLTLGTSF